MLHSLHPALTPSSKKSWVLQRPHLVNSINLQAKLCEDSWNASPQLTCAKWPSVSHQTGHRSWASEVTGFTSGRGSSERIDGGTLKIPSGKGTSKLLHYFALNHNYNRNKGVVTKVLQNVLTD